MKHFIAPALLLLLLATTGHACPLVLNNVDTNCDGELRVLFTGDSIVKGVGAETGQSYPQKTENKVGSLLFKALNLGVPGSTGQRLKRAFIKHIDKGKKTTKFTTAVDHIFIQLGTNAFFDNITPAQEAGKIKRLVKYLREALKLRNGTEPVIITATPPLTERGYQNGFILELAQQLLRTKGINLLVRFDTIPVEQLAINDTLHPSGPGYKKMAARVTKALFSKKFRTRASKIYKDKDGDGIYDATEVGLFLTDPTVADSDGDGLSDGDELLVHETNPNLTDTDGDTISDFVEVTNGTDPLSANEP